MKCKICTAEDEIMFKISFYHDGWEHPETLVCCDLHMSHQFMNFINPISKDINSVTVEKLKLP